MPELGLFGKIPAKGDFVRHNVTGATARAFEQWVQESNDALRGAGGEMPEHTIRCVFTPPGSDTTVVGVLVPSEDKVGRKFPLALFAEAPVAEARDGFSAVPVGWAPFLDGAAALCDRAKELDWDQLRSALPGLPQPGPSELSRAKEVCEQALGHPLPLEVHDRIFGEGSPMHFYAYQTFLTACEDASKNDPSKPSTVLDCPIHVDVDLFFWLEMTRRIFGFPPAHPQAMWIEDPAPRLLVSLGPASLQMLSFMAKPDMQHNRLWPLTTDRDKAVEAAKSTLGPALDHLNDQSPFGSLLESLVQRAASGTMR
ncbi:MAG: type VI secretion system-associated protein TagF [Sandaracinaceae bacterium]|nr:type VI secretion system-associated protein TagF [Sandaracinaceae bacterium]